MSVPRLSILVSPEHLTESVATLARSLPEPLAHAITLRAVSGELRDAIERLRDESSELLGVIVPDEASVRVALAHGADDALAMSVPSASELASFLARLAARASQRDGRPYEALAHHERLATLGALVAGVGHEINNPLSAILLYVEAARSRLLPALELTFELARAAQGGEVPKTLLDALRELELPERTSKDAPRMFDDLREAAEAIATIVGDLRAFARFEPDEGAQLLDATELVEQVLRLVGRELSAHAIVERDYAPDLPLLVAPRHRLAQVITNVLVNAAHAIREVERRDHRVRVSTRADDELVTITVRDTGPGIAPEALERIFDPFFTTRKGRVGTGLGLSISREILRRLGGDLVVESVHGEGATFSCRLPRPSKERLAEAYRDPNTQVPARSGRAQATVLVVDDDARLRFAYARLLGDSHRLLTAGDVNEAIELLGSGSQPDVIVLELQLPGRDGRALLSYLEAERPALRERTLIVTSAALSSTHTDFLRAHSGPVLHKPVSGPELLRAIERLLD